MKNILFVLTMVCLLSASAFAANPQIRVCNLYNADFLTLEIEKPKKDQIGFCSYGDSFVGSLTFMTYYFEEKNTKAMDAFYKTQNTQFATCELAGADEIIGYDLSEDKSDIICVFDDYSFISLKTLTEGWNSEFNQELVNNL